MSKIEYHIVEHDGGWAYKCGDVFSEAFASHDQALQAAKRAAAEQAVPGDTEVIQYEDRNGRWHVETAAGGDRPSVSVKDGD
jgi:hypothetical protein